MHHANGKHNTIVEVDRNGIHARHDVDDLEQSRADKPRNGGDASQNLLYGIRDTPPWYICVLLGFQHYLTMFGSTVSVPLIITPAMCFGDDHVGKSEVIGTIFFVSGLVTLLQCILGVRLPIVQGATFGFLAPTFAILALPKWTCPADLNNLNTTDARREVWEPRMREVQGAIVVASLFQIVIGFSGIIGLLLAFISPITISVTIALVGLALFEVAANFCSAHWWIALLTILLLTLFSQYLRNIEIPWLGCSAKERTCKVSRYPFFRVFPVILAILLSWLLCYILTKTDVFPDNPEKWGYRARTDTKMSVLTEAKWFRFPYPGQWGAPTVSVAAVFGMLSGVLASMVESIGDYYAAARLSHAPPPPVNAINRGILIEGIGCVLAGLWGTGNGTTSYSENIGAISITKVASRRVIQIGAIVMMLFGVFGKFGAFFVTIPDPIIGGIFMVMFGTVFAVGVSNLQYIDLNSGRNLYVFGFSMLFGLALPKWMSQNPDVISTGSDNFDQVLTVLLSTSMFVGGVVAAVLDNTIPGTERERGITGWRHNLSSADASSTADTTTSGAAPVYDLPLCMEAIRRVTCFRFLPICPTFKGLGWATRKSKDKEEKQCDENLDLEEQETVVKF